MKKHTQGEWMEFNGKIVTKPKSTLLTDYDTTICKLNCYLEESMLNAKLIVSAPELLKALQLLVNDIERNDGDLINRNTLINEAKQVISKATK
jgi:hypothetical protein